MDPSQSNASSLVEIPIIHELLRHEKSSSPFSQTTIDVCCWMLNRGRTVLNLLTKGPQPPRIPAGSIQKPWTEANCGPCILRTAEFLFRLAPATDFQRFGNDRGT